MCIAEMPIFCCKSCHLPPAAWVREMRRKWNKKKKRKARMRFGCVVILCVVFWSVGVKFYLACWLVS